MISVADLPLWAKSLIAPAVVLVTMFIMAGIAFVDLASQEANIAYLDGVAFEDLHKAMVAAEAVTEYQTELYRLVSIASNETDQPKVDEMAARLTLRLGAIAPLIELVVPRGEGTEIQDAFAGYDWSAREMIEFTRHDAAYGVMMMGYVEPLFEHLRGLLTERSSRAQDERNRTTAGLLAGLGRMRFEFRLLVSVGAIISITVALLIARAISAPAARLTRTMASLAKGGFAVEIPDRQRRDEFGAMAMALEVFKLSMIKAHTADAQVQRSEQRLHVIFDAVDEGIVVQSVATGMFIDGNPRAFDMAGYARDEFLTLRFADLVAAASPFTMASLTALQETTPKGEPVSFEMLCKARDGHTFFVEVSARRATYGGEDVYVSTVRNIAARKRTEAQIARMARYDNLTGLVNRRVFVEVLGQTIARARRSGMRFAVLYLDLDHFKDVNDTLGHPVGDALLKTVAERLLASVREVDTVARFGGDEFAIILEDIAEPDNAADVSEWVLDAISDGTAVRPDVTAAAARAANKIVTAVAETIVIENNRIHSGATIGIAVYGLDSPDAETMLSHADVALYRAKAEHRGHFRFFTDGMDAEVRARVSMSAQLREAIAADEFFLLYQPQVDLDTGRIVGLEALIRWRHPQLGVLGPGKFIAVAENNGLIVPLGRWVLEEACRQTGQWLNAGIAPPLIAVNLSGIQFKRPLGLEKDIAAAVSEAGLPPRILELELTETVLMEASRDHNELLSRLRQQGYRIAIDDFGSGYSSLDYLRRYPVDRIKIAQTFIAGIGIEPGNDAIVRAALGLARELNIEVVVEGVESLAQLELLKTWGGRIVQGYYFARPLPVPEVTALLRLGSIVPASARLMEIAVPA